MTKISLTPLHPTSFFTDLEQVALKNESIIFQTLKKVGKKDLGDSHKITTSHLVSYFFEHKNNGLLKLAFYSLFFSLATTLLIYLQKYFRKNDG